jgi:hypothetical protein
MWLLDANMPLQLVVLLKGLGIQVDSAITRGWNRLSNGAFVSAAVGAGFDVLLTSRSIVCRISLANLKNSSRILRCLDLDAAKTRRGLCSRLQGCLESTADSSCPGSGD